MKFSFNNKVYDVLKYVCMIILPALGTLYSVLANIWDWPCADQVVGTTSAISACIGVAIGISTVQYNKDELQKAINNGGELHYTKEPDEPIEYEFGSSTKNNGD